MHAHTSLLVLTSALSVAASTIPTKRQQGCSTLYPMLRVSPNTSIPYGVRVDSNAPTEIGFYLPENAVGPCTLKLNLPAGPTVTGGAQVNLIDLDGPAQGSVVGTSNFYAGSVATINSFACRPTMCYGLQTADGKTVDFMETDASGVVMTYGC